MKKIKIGDHEITIGPKVVTITEDTTITPTTDMEIRFNLPDDVSGSNNICTVTLGTAPVGCMVKFIFNYTITTLNRYKNIIISHDNKAEYYIRGMNAIYIYNGTRWQAIGVTETLSINANGLIFTGKYYEGKPVHVYVSSTRIYPDSSKWTQEGNYDVVTYDFSSAIPVGADVISITGAMGFSTVSTTADSFLTIGSTRFSGSGTMIYNVQGRPKDKCVIASLQRANPAKVAQYNLIVEYVM